MTQEEKDLLKKVICEMLPYGVRIAIGNIIYPITSIDVSLNRIGISVALEKYIEDIKPYLRPMSSMTEKEKECYEYLCSTDEEYRQPFDSYHLIDWLNENLFDYRGLIEKGLALPAPEDMYNKNSK